MQKNNPTTLYLSLESTIKTIARVMAYNWRVNSSDLLSVGNESFLKALNTFDGEKECSLKSWCITVVKTSMYDECRKIKLQKNRFLSFSDLSKETDKDVIFDIENCISAKDTKKHIELENELKKFSKTTQQYALTRMKGYNAHEIAKYRMMSRRDILKAKKEIELCHK